VTLVIVLEDTSRFKQITGGDRIAANRKFMTPIYFENFAKIINSCNDLPKTKDLSDGFWRRWVLIRFNEKFILKGEWDVMEEEDRKTVHLADEDVVNNITSEQEMEGLLNFALVGLHRLLGQKGFSYSRTTKETQVDWVRLSSSFSAFCMDMIIQINNEEDYITKDILRHKYNEYCKKYNVKVETDKSI